MLACIGPWSYLFCVCSGPTGKRSGNVDLAVFGTVFRNQTSLTDFFSNMGRVGDFAGVASRVDGLVIIST